MTKHLSLAERNIIENMLLRDYSFASIARALNRSASSVSREIQHYRSFTGTSSSPYANDCIHYASCLHNKLCTDYLEKECYGSRCKRCPEKIDCTSICSGYISSHCSLLDKPPYVCSSCPHSKQQGCKKVHAYYTAHRANAAHLKAVKEAHSGIRLKPKELEQLGLFIKPLISKGQSLNHICVNHPDRIPVSERSLYNYIDQNVFEVRNIDLPKKVVYRKRKERKVLTHMEYRYRQGRSYADFQTYMMLHPDLPVVEMDTVKGARGSEKVLLTMIFRNTNFMLIFLMPDGTQSSVAAVFDDLTDILGVDLFHQLFPIILTDNGVEFKDPERLENTDNGFPRTKLFYCDPQASWQKPHVENSHRLIRRILPKGTSFTWLSSYHIHLVCCHINSVSREALGNITPFQRMTSEAQKKLLSSLNLHSIPPDEVVLKPALINQ